MNDNKIITNILKLWGLIESTHKRLIFPIILLMVLASIAEIFSIGMLIPFLSVILDPIALIKKINSYGLLPGINLDIANIQLLVTVVFSITAIIAGILRVSLIYATIKISFAIGTSLSTKIFKNTLSLDYETHKEINSSSTIDAIINKTNTLINGAIMPSLVIISSLIYGATILIALSYFSPFQALVASSILGFIYLIISFNAKKSILENGEIISIESTNALKTVQEGLGAIRDLILDKSISDFVNRYTKHDKLLRDAQGNNIFLSSCPKYILEAFGISIIAGYAFLSSDSQSTYEIVTTLSILAICAQRLLPVIQQGYSSWVNISGASTIVSEALEILSKSNHTLEGNESELFFKNSIILKNITFKYSSRKQKILDDASLTINLGDKIGVIGETGSGKSTLVDLLMGLLKPTTGYIEVDGVKITNDNITSYQRLIAHVPQSVYLLDTSLKNNILLNISNSEIDYAKYVNSLERTKLSSVIKKLPNGDSEVVGEHGLKLSGGQRQRIGIARALYKNPKILIMDEATSALDLNTENEIISSIQQYEKKSTIIMIAHRINTLKSCNRFIKIENGKIIEVTRSEVFTGIDA